MSTYAEAPEFQINICIDELMCNETIELENDMVTFTCPEQDTNAIKLASTMLQLLVLSMYLLY